MSKWQLPSQKGTELWPSPTRSPVRLVIEGVEPGSGLAIAISRRFAGEINQFYLAQAQKYSLGVAPSQQGHTVRPGIRMQYQNSQGKETIRVKVTDKQVMREETEKLDKPWDWLLLDYVIPLGGFAVSAILSARRTIPEAIESAILRGGLVYDSTTPPLNVDGLDPPVTRYPKAIGDRAVTIDDTSQVSSLAIDLRRFNKGGVTVDVFGNLEVGSELVLVSYSAGDATGAPGVSTLVGTATRTFSTDIWTPDVTTIAGFWTHQGSAVILAPVDQLDQTLSVEDAPYTHTPLTSPTVELNTTGGIGITPVLGQGTHDYNITTNPDSGLVTSFTSSTFTVDRVSSVGDLENWEAYELVQENTRLHGSFSENQPVPTTVVGDMRFTAGWGAPPWRDTDVTADVPGGLYQRLGLDFDDSVRFIGTASLNDNVPISGPFPGGDTYTYLGKLIIDPIRHAAAFEAA